MKNLLLLCAILVLPVQSAFAGCDVCDVGAGGGNTQCGASGTLDRDHFYMGVGGGFTSNKDPVGGSRSGITKIDIGSRSNQLAYEFNYDQVGTIGSINNVDHYGLSIMGYLRKPQPCEYDEDVEIGPFLNFFGRLGYGVTSTKFANGTSTGTRGFYFGVGVEYELFSNLSVRGEVSKFNRADSTPSVTDSIVEQSASLVYHF